MSWIKTSLFIFIFIFASAAQAEQTEITAVAAQGKSVFYQLESSGRKNIAATKENTALVWSVVTKGAVKSYAAFKSNKENHFSKPVSLSLSNNSFNPVVVACGEHFISAWIEAEAIKARRIARNKSGKIVTVAQGKINELSIACKNQDAALMTWSNRNNTISRVIAAEYKINNWNLSEIKKATIAPFEKYKTQSSPGIVYTKGRYIVTWHDRTKGTNSLYCSSGPELNKMSQPVQINKWIKKSDKWGKGSSAIASVLAVKNGLLTIAWLDKRESRSGYKVFSAFSYDGGKSWGKNHKIADESANHSPQWSVSLTTDNNGQAAVAWMDSRYDENTVWLSTLRGKTWTEEIDVSTNAENKPRSPVMTFGPGNILHMAWIENTPSNKGAQIIYKTEKVSEK